jgi:hypothetical protein
LFLGIGMSIFLAYYKKRLGDLFVFPFGAEQIVIIGNQQDIQLIANYEKEKKILCIVSQLFSLLFAFLSYDYY